MKRQEVRKDSLVSKEVGGEDRGRVGQLRHPEQEGCADESRSKSRSGPLVEMEMLLFRKGCRGAS